MNKQSGRWKISWRIKKHKGKKKTFPEAISHLPGNIGGGFCPLVGQSMPRINGWAELGVWIQFSEGLGFCAFGADPRRGCLRPLGGCFLSSIFKEPQTSNPKWKKGTEEYKWLHTKGLLFSGLLWLILQCCKYVCRHFWKHVFMSLTVNAPFLKFYNVLFN